MQKKQLTMLNQSNQQIGIAYLVGAGCGHPGLITQRGVELLQEADVVLYDRLIAKELLELPRKGAKLIFVGKRPGCHSKTQDSINRLLVDLVANGNKVVRLKGGDPFVFGRGGEEVSALLQANLPYEIVPGVTSPIGVLAFAGIPLTHKGINSSFTIMTGSESLDKQSSMTDWAKLAQQEMIVFLMGFRRIEHICQQLITHGKPRETPAALVSCGTLSQQQTLISTLETLPTKFADNPLPIPGIIVVGEVVKLHSQINACQPIGEASDFATSEIILNRQELLTSNTIPQYPRVSLVGAGPGDPKLITTLGLDRLRSADVVLHDRLVSSELLSEANHDAKIINVGKSDRRDRYKQSEVSRILIEQAKSGKRIVRLKGGDPFVFGLGAEECFSLNEANIAYEIIPGVSSITAAPAFAGIPLTRRGVNIAITVISGHAGPNSSQLNKKVWSHIPSHSTLVIPMGLRRLPEIIDHLLTLDWDQHTPIALIQSGGTAQQRVVTGSLQSIILDSELAQLSSPVLIVIGDVINFQPAFSWFEPNLTEVTAVWGKAVA